MRWIRILSIASLSVALLLVGYPPVVEAGGGKPKITEGPDPIPHAPTGSDSDCGVPGADDTGRDDGRPDLVVDPTTGGPIVVWAYDAVIDHDIAVGEWTGDDCRLSLGFLTSSLVDELDPRVFVDRDGTAYVVWWEAGLPERVLLSYRLAGSRYWEFPSEIATGGRRPAVVVHNGQLLVAYERDAADGQEIVLAVPGESGYDLEVVATTTRSAGLDVVMHSAAGRLWVEWKHSDTELAYSQRVSARWTTPTIVPRTNRSLARLGPAPSPVHRKSLSP
jgi:hypothetical protein